MCTLKFREHVQSWQPPTDTSPQISLSPNHYDTLTSILMSSPNLKFYMAISEFITTSCPQTLMPTAGQWSWPLWLNSPVLGPSKLCWFVLSSCLLVFSLPSQTQFFMHSFYSLDNHSEDFILILQRTTLRSRGLKHIAGSTHLGKGRITIETQTHLVPEAKYFFYHSSGSH